MPVIDSLSPAQRQVVEAIKNERATIGRRNTLDALLRDSLIELKPGSPSRSTGLLNYRLTVSGLALFEEDAMRANRVGDFTVGQSVEVLIWGGINGARRAEWHKATVLRVGKAMLIIRYPLGAVARKHPASVRALADRTWRDTSEMVERCPDCGRFHCICDGPDMSACP